MLRAWQYCIELHEEAKEPIHVYIIYIYMVDGTNEKNFLPIVHYRICAPEKFCAFKHENNVGLPFAVCPCPCSCVCVRFVVAIEQYTISYNFINSNKFMKIVTHQCTLTLGLIRPTVIIPHSPPPLNQVLCPGLWIIFFFFEYTAI